MFSCSFVSLTNDVSPAQSALIERSGGYRGELVLKKKKKKKKTIAFLRMCSNDVSPAQGALAEVSGGYRGEFVLMILTVV